MRDTDELNAAPGVEVCYIPPYPRGDKPEKWEILTIERVTQKAGQIVTKDGRRFDREGGEIGDAGRSSWGGSHGWIFPATPERREQIQHAQDVTFLATYRWHTLSHQEARTIYREIVEDAQKRAAEKMREKHDSVLREIADALARGTYDGLAL